MARTAREPRLDERGIQMVAKGPCHHDETPFHIPCIGRARAGPDRSRTRLLRCGPGIRGVWAGGSHEGWLADGIGDEAFAGKGQLMVRKGQTCLLISVVDRRGVRGGAKELQAEKTLAALALGRM